MVRITRASHWLSEFVIVIATVPWCQLMLLTATHGNTLLSDSIKIAAGLSDAIAPFHNKTDPSCRRGITVEIALGEPSPAAIALDEANP
jgi:hypothetical protein